MSQLFYFAYPSMSLPPADELWGDSSMSASPGLWAFNPHQPFIEQLTLLNQMTQLVKAEIKTKGLSLTSIQHIGPQRTPMLVCSDVIESIFGKYKAKINRGVGGIYDSMLMIPLFCQELSPKIVQQILQKVTFTEVLNWGREIRGLSNLAKRRKAFDSS